MANEILPQDEGGESGRGRVSGTDDVARNPGGFGRALTESAGDNAPVSSLTQTQLDSETPVRLRSFTPAGRGGDRYTLLGEIARGGMGAILKGRDSDLGRDLAIKILLDAHKDDPAVVLRFIEEAQIGGQLQHPGIVPVYELGEFVDKRLFFSMKLVKGQSLHLLLSQREDVGSDRPRFLGIFQQVCQTLAYAHNRHVIHRDLKPANIMVGAFGEVQVMDWGLAKVLSPPGENAEDAPDEKASHLSLIHTRRQSDGDGVGLAGWQTQAGSALGTPAYMSPEQARGEVDLMDERVDVFGLGAILCEILTGRPPYAAGDSKEVFRMAMRGKLDACHERLQACDADRDLVDLARACLSPEPDERPRHAGVVTERISVYLASVESRLRASEIERAAEAARAEEALHTAAEAHAKVRAERATRRLQLAFASVFLVVTSVAWFLADRNAIRQTALKNEARNAEQWATLQRQRAEAAQKRADQTLIEMQTSRGLVAAARNAPDEAALWFAEAAVMARDASDATRETPNRLRARNWLRRAPVPVAVLNVGGNAERLAFQPGGDVLLVTAGRLILLWNWRDGKLLPWSEGLSDVSAACFSPDGKSAALAFGSGEVQIRDIASGAVGARVPSAAETRSLAFSPDGTALAVGSPAVRLWDVAGKKLLSAAYKHPLPVNALAFNRKGDRVLTACDDKQARVFDVSRGETGTEPLFKPVPHQPTRPSPPALVRDDKAFVTVSAHDRLTVRDIATGAPLAEPLKARQLSLSRVVSSADGQWFAGASYWGLLGSATQLGKAFQLEHVNDIWDIQFSPDGTTLLSVGRDQLAKLWSVGTGRQIGQDMQHMSSVDLCGWSSDSRYFATAQNDGLIRVWQRPAETTAPWVATDWGQRARVGFDGRYVVPGLWHEAPFGYGAVATRRLRVLRSDGQIDCDVDLPGRLNDACMLGDNRTVAAVSSEGGKNRLGLWDVTTKRAVIEQPVALPAMATSLAARPGSKELAVLCCNGDLLIVDGATGRVRKGFPLGMRATVPERTPRVEYTPDGRSLVALEYYRPERLSVRDADSGELRFDPIQPCGNDQSPCRSFALSADSRYLATIVNGRNEARVWDLATGRPLCEPIPHPGDGFGLFSVCFSPDGRFLLTGHKDHQLRYWNWRTGELACPAMDQVDEVYGVAITGDGRHAISSSRTPAVVNLWDLESGRVVAPAIPIGPAGNDTVETVSLSLDSSRAFIASRANLAILDLDGWLKPPDSSPADIALLAELTTARRITAGDLNKLTKGEWQTRWDELQGRNPGFVRSGVTYRSDVIAQRSADSAIMASSAYARRGEWSKAAERAVSSVDADPEQRIKWASAAALIILAGDVQGYRDLRARMFKRFASTADPQEADSLSKVALLLPGFADRASLPIGVLIAAAEDAQRSPTTRRWYYASAGLAAYRDGDWETAAKRCERSLEISLRQGPEGSLALLVLAMARHKQDRRELATNLLDEAGDLIPTDLATLGTKEHAASLPAADLVAHHDWQTAEILRREAATLIHGSAGRTTDIHPLVSRSLSLLPHDRMDEALADARKAIELNPRSRLAHSVIAIILMKQRKPEEAAAECLKEIEFHPRDPSAYWILGEIRIGQGMYEEAGSLAGKALECDARTPAAHNVLGKVYMDSGRFDEAAQEFFAEIGIGAVRAADAYANLGLVRFYQGKPEDAASTYRKSIELEPKNSSTRYMLAQSLMATGRLDQALGQTDEALQLTPGDPASTKLRGDLAQMLGLLPRLDAFVAGIAKPADNIERVLLARLCMYRGQAAQGARYYAEAIASDPALVSDPAEFHAFRSATAAARAGRGDGEPRNLDEGERSRFRRQAIAHLRILLASIEKLLPTLDLPRRRSFMSILHRCKATADFAGIRDAELIARLPADEQVICDAFWSDVDKLLKVPPRDK